MREWLIGWPWKPLLFELAGSNPVLSDRWLCFWHQTVIMTFLWLFATQTQTRTDSGRWDSDWPHGQTSKPQYLPCLRTQQLRSRIRPVGLPTAHGTTHSPHSLVGRDVDDIHQPLCYLSIDKIQVRTREDCLLGPDRRTVQSWKRTKYNQNSIFTVTGTEGHTSRRRVPLSQSKLESCPFL